MDILIVPLIWTWALFDDLNSLVADFITTWFSCVILLIKVCTLSIIIELIRLIRKAAIYWMIIHWTVIQISILINSRRLIRLQKLIIIPYKRRLVSIINRIEVVCTDIQITWGFLSVFKIRVDFLDNFVHWWSLRLILYRFDCISIIFTFIC